MSERSGRRGTISEIVPVAAVEPDGLAITTDGTYVRVLACERVLQPFRGGPGHRDRMRGRLAALCARISPGQSIQIVVSAEPVDPDRALAPDQAEIAAAISRADGAGDPERARALKRLGLGLEQTIRRHAPALEAVELASYVVVPHRPPQPPFKRPRVRAQAVRTVGQSAHQVAADESLRTSELYQGELEGLGCAVRRLAGAELLTLLWARLHPGEQPSGAPHGLPRVLVTDAEHQALEHRRALLEGIGAGALLDLSDRDLLEHVEHGQVEQVLHLTRQPESTSLWWLMYLMQTPPPWVLSVHISATDRIRERRRHRLRRRRLWADLRRREREGKLISEEDYEREREAGELDGELRMSGAAGIYNVSCELALRRPADRRDELAQVAETVAKEFESITDAGVYPGRFVAADSWTSTLPLGVDRLAATRRYGSRNIGDCVPLLSSTASASGGVPFGFAEPGHTLERVDLFDPSHRTYVATVAGRSGTGKTAATCALVSRNIARGARGLIIDSSSTETEDGASRGQGHWEPLASLVPGSRTVRFADTAHAEILCPWDVPDPARPPAGKVAFLTAWHTLLIGDPDPATQSHTLGGLERTQLERGIEAVYARAAVTGERPRETMLQEELRRLAREEQTDPDGDAAVGAALRSLAARLHPYCESGSYSWLADHESTIPDDAPLLLCDLAGLPEQLIGPVVLALIERFDRIVQRRRCGHIGARGHGAGGGWEGRSFVVLDEGWKFVRAAAAGHWLNEWARRARHYDCALIALTQHLQDFATEHGQALIRNSVLRIQFQTAPDELHALTEALGWGEEDIQTVSQELETRKGYYSTCYLDSEVNGRTKVRVLFGDMEYWVCSNDPFRDQPVRALALKEAGGDPWRALRLLCDPAWHRARQDQVEDAIDAAEDCAPQLPVPV